MFTVPKNNFMIFQIAALITSLTVALLMFPLGIE